MTTLGRTLRAIVGERHCLTDPDLRASYETDWTRRWSGSALAVVRPGSTDEVAAVLRACADAGVGVVPQGGNTGLVGGSVPRGGEVVLDPRLDGIEDLDADAGEVTAGAGATLASVRQRHERPDGTSASTSRAGQRDDRRDGGHERRRRERPAPRTDAPAAARLRGRARRRHRAAPPAGDAEGQHRLRPRRPARRLRGDAGGHHPARCGSCRRWPGGPSPSSVSPTRRGRRGSRTAAARARIGPGLELFTDAGLELVMRHAGVPPRSRPPAGLPARRGRLRRVGPDRRAACRPRAPRRRRRGVGRSPPIRPGGIGSGSCASATPRRSTPRACRTSSTCRCPSARLRRDGGAGSGGGRAADPTARTIVYGHVGDGNVHVNVLGPAPDDERVDAAVLELVLRARREHQRRARHRRGEGGWLSVTVDPRPSPPCARSSGPGIRAAS